VRGAAPVGGGSINHAARVELATGTVFVKYSDRAPPGLFAAEAEGLRALAGAGSGLVVPRVLAVSDAFLAMEWLEPAAETASSAERLGRGVALLHRASAATWGWAADNFIATLPQPNAPAASWAEFWRARRLQPQLERARATGHAPGSEREWERLWERLPDLLAPAEQDGPSLLHGDLWSGNALSTAASPALVDPAVYHGHREVDLAMTELFGGFGARFHDTYAEAWPPLPGYREERRAVYQLFPLLVHVNLFGGGYGARTAEVLRSIVG
jgi:fructosamine-3-kinase